MKINWKELKIFGIMLAIFLAAYYIPFESSRFKGGVLEAFYMPVSYTHLRAHETPEHLVCRLLLEKKNSDQYASDCLMINRL